MADNTRILHPKLAIFDRFDRKTGDLKPGNACSHFVVPSFFIADLMRIGKKTPPSFWKFTFVILQKTLKPEWNKEDEAYFNPYEFLTTDKQLAEDVCIGAEAVQDWRNAYRVSGLFTVKVGNKKNPKANYGEPTRWTYNVNATKRDWEAFILAFTKVINPADGMRLARHGKDEGKRASDAYMVAMALAVDEARTKRMGISPLPPIHTAFIDKLVQVGIVKRLPSGEIDYENLRVPAQWKGLEEPNWHGEGDLQPEHAW